MKTKILIALVVISIVISLGTINSFAAGNIEMDNLAKILYAADKTEENRKSEQFNIEYERELANSNIDEAIIFMIDASIMKNIKEKKLIHPDSINTRNNLLIKIRKSL